jgi:hypothetical protein
MLDGPPVAFYTTLFCAPIGIMRFRIVSEEEDERDRARELELILDAEKQDKAQDPR